VTHLELLSNIFHVGFVDWEVRNFHGYSTHRGSSYNSYIVKGEKTVLIDTVKEPYYEYFLRNIKEVCDPSEIDYLIVNHVEPDHSGSFPYILNHLPNAEIIASKRGVENLKKHYHHQLKEEVFGKIRSVEEGDTLEIGDGKKFTFVPIPMIHWPDSMVSFMSDENGKNLLFSNDAFGQHLATSKIWDDENDLSVILQEAEKYYANILLHLSGLIAKAIPKVGALPIDIICPSHGVCWRTHIGQILEKYKKWSSGVIDQNQILIVYDSMWGSTEKIAKALYKEIEHRGLPVKRFKLTQTDYSDVITEAMKSRAIIVGSPTLNNGLYPTVAEYLSYQKGLKPMNKIGMAFGSFGWGGGAIKEIESELEKTKIDVLDKSIKVQFVPDTEELEELVKDAVDLIVENL
jgi:flavorubredoxin